MVESEISKNSEPVHDQQLCRLENATSIFVITIWASLTGSFIWLLVTIFSRYYWYPSKNQMHQFEGSGPIWLIPLADVVYALPLAAILAIFFSISKRLLAPKVILRLCVFVIVLLVCLATLTMVPRIYSYAKIILALGITIQITRAIVKSQQKARWWIRNSSVVMFAIAVLIAVGSYVSIVRREQAAIANLPSVSSERPNILLITLDTVRAESMSLYGHKRKTTPFLDQFSKQGVTFDRAIAPCSWTLPTHASVFTGKNPHEIEAGFVTPMDGRFPTLAEVLTKNGYATAGLVANFSYCGKRTGIHRGMIHFEETRPWPAYYDQRSIIGRLATRSIVKRMTGRMHHHGFDRRSATQMTDDTLQWIDSLKVSNPFFCFVNYFDAHTPLEPPLDIHVDFVAQNTFDPNSDADLIKYEALIYYIDQELKRLIDGLRERKKLENTLIIITSDHGEQFGEHALRLHGNSLYTQLIHVPLVIVFPDNVPKSVRVEDFVTLKDLSATVLKVADVSESMPGESLSRYWNPNHDVTNGDEWIICQLQQTVRQEGLPNSNGPIISIIADGFHFIQNFGQNSVELYDLKKDLRELNNLAELPEHEKVLRLQQYLFAHMFLYLKLVEAILKQINELH